MVEKQPSRTWEGCFFAYPCNIENDAQVLMEQKIAEQLTPYVPTPAMAALFARWIVEHCVQVKVISPRSGVRGRYSSPRGPSDAHRISMNASLNPYAFAITFIHEMAHLHTWLRHKGAVAPHGPEWKAAFRELMAPFLRHNAFPEAVADALSSYMRNPAASSCRDPALMQALGAYDPALPAGYAYLSDLPEGARFAVDSGKCFVKGPLLRKNFHCRELGTGRQYAIRPHAVVWHLEDR
jgi:hypothetical protein